MFAKVTIHCSKEQSVQDLSEYVTIAKYSPSKRKFRLIFIFKGETNLLLRLQAAYKEARPIPICKYIVLGESRSGKSTLGKIIYHSYSNNANFLVNNLVNFMHSQKGRKTRTAKRGFDLVEVTSIEIPDKEIVEFYIWDFQYLALTL